MLAAGGLANRGAARLRAGALLFSLLLVARGAGAIQIETFQLTGISLGGCNVENTSSCTRIDISETWPNPTAFTVNYDLDGIVGNVVPMTITDLYLPNLSALGSDDEFNINGAGFLTPASVTGHFNMATGFVDLGFNLVVRRNGDSSASFAYLMTTGNNTVLASTPCADVDITIPGSNHNAITHALSIIGNQCVNIAPAGASADNRILQVSLTGVLPPPTVVPEPSTLILVGAALAGLAGAKRRG